MKYVVEYRGTAKNMYGHFLHFYDGQTTRWGKSMDTAMHFNTREDAQAVCDMVTLRSGATIVIEYVAKKHTDAYDRAMGVV